MKKKKKDEPGGFHFLCLLFVQPSATSSVTGIPWEKGERGKELVEKKKKLGQRQR
jgi:hypothetical protein